MTATITNSGKIIVTGKKEHERGDIVHSVVIGKEEFYLRATDDSNFFTYGCKQLAYDPVWGHPAGYIWSSRASVMNKLFGTKLIDITYWIEGTYKCYGCIAVTVDFLNELLKNTEYVVDIENPSVSDEDIVYNVVKKSV